MEKFLSFHNFLNESENTVISADKAPMRIKDSTGTYYTKTPKVIYLNKGSMLSDNTKKFLLPKLKENDLYLINPSLWLKTYFKSEERDIVFSVGDKNNLETHRCFLKNYKGSDLEKIGNSKDFEYVNVQILPFKEFNIYKVKVYGLEKWITSPSEYSAMYLDTKTIYFINKQNAKFSGNVKSFSDAFGLSKPEEKKESWAILIAKNDYRESDVYYSWVRNDGYDEPIADVKDFRKTLKRMAEIFGDKKFHSHSSSFKIYYDKNKFISDYKKLSGNMPAI